MITIFSIPKAFNGHINIIQRNAIKSWTSLCPRCQVVLCGDDSGTEEVAKEFDVKCIPDIARNEFGTPLLSSAFERIREVAANNLLCYVNSDIIFMSDFILAIRRIKTDQFLLFGNRWNIDINEEIDFNDNNWETKIKEYIKLKGSLQPPIGADYFVFKKNEALSDIPPFAVGRPLWDNWFIYNARKNKYKVIDASKAILALHQNHGYGHLQSDYCTKKGKSIWECPEGPEVDRQKEIMNGQEKFFSLSDATHILTENRLKRAIDYQHLRRQFNTLSVFYPHLKPLIKYVEEKIMPFLRKYKIKLFADRKR